MKFVTRVPQVLNRTEKAKQKALLQTGKDVYTVSQQLVPKDTTSLQHSGGVVPLDSRTVQVGYGVQGVFFEGREPYKYAVPVEFGSSRSSAQPYLTPAFAQSPSTFTKRVRDEYKDAVS